MELEGAFWEEQLGWSFPTEGFSWSCIEHLCDTIQVVLEVAAEVFFFGQVLTQPGSKACAETVSGFQRRKPARTSHA